MCIHSFQYTTMAMTLQAAISGGGSLPPYVDKFFEVCYVLVCMKICLPADLVDQTLSTSFDGGD